MEVLRDHLLGVSDSGKVSGRGVLRTADRWRDPGAMLRILGSSLRHRVTTVALELNLRVWLLGNADSLVTRFIAWLGWNDTPEARSGGVLAPHCRNP